MTLHRMISTKRRRRCGTRHPGRNRIQYPRRYMGPHCPLRSGFPERQECFLSDDREHVSGIHKNEQKPLTGSMPTITHSGLCFFLIALESPVTVPPVPAPAIMTSTFLDEGLDEVEGVDTTASIISGPVVYSCARGLFT